MKLIKKLIFIILMNFCFLTIIYSNKCDWNFPFKDLTYSEQGLNSYEGHTGIDIFAPNGTPVYAAANGIVRQRDGGRNIECGKYNEESNSKYGIFVKIEYDNGGYGFYAHLSECTLAKDQRVIKGSTIGYSGCSGNTNSTADHKDYHLHYEERDGDGSYGTHIYPYKQGGHWYDCSIPPGDNPDENYSIANSYDSIQAELIPDSAQWSFWPKYNISMFSNGYGWSCARFVSSLSRINSLMPVQIDLNYADLSSRPLLIIPSGGLMGMENSETFKQILAKYVSEGGNILCFTQQQGYEFSALPGGKILGYGWRSDVSCWSNSVELVNYNQVLSSIKTNSVNMNVDGYFTSWDSTTTVLLRRTKNGMPAMLMWKYGKGTVIATTAYDDWSFGASTGQITSQGNSICRDIITWLKNPVELAEYKPGQSFDLTVSIINPRETHAYKFRTSVFLGKDIISEFTDSTLNLGGGENTNINFSYTAPKSLGIYQIGYTLYDTFGNEFWREPEAARFVVSNPPPVAQPISNLYFSIQSDAENYARGSNPVFTIIGWNNSDEAKTITAKYFFPHHYWDTHNNQYGGDWSRPELHLTQTMMIPPKGSTNFV
ncbi:MAG: M23 family metallopeptidase, partial [Candidatus Firestonebacteria bacterium]|nr:M23 family metallopeptidase [Candidatus Firestonebacteria bacterium]